MNYRLLGRSGLRVSEICLGAMTFGEDWGWGADKEACQKLYDIFRAAGGNFVDTANVYTNGTSESLLGEFMEGHREQIVLSTKYTLSNPTEDPNASGNHRKSMFQSVEASLKRLRTDYIDLYWVHIWDRITPVEEVMRGLDDLVRAGKVLHVGISDAPAWWVARANTLAEGRGWTSFTGLQIEYSLIERSVERELVPMAEALGLTITAWSPLSSGVLTGKYKDGNPSEGRLNDESMAAFMPEKERTDRIVAAVLDVAGQVGRSPAQVALAWLLQRPNPVIPIVGARKLHQLEDNLAATTLKLDAEHLATLDAASALPPGFPTSLYANPVADGLTYGSMRDRILV
ncbi:aldo/keto reductase [filamentous cyanobacterium CCP2]|nr:aldo/keto reductase [filamentous cyanobacterium CCP2]